MRRRLWKKGALLAGMICLAQVVLAADKSLPNSMSAEEFGRLSVADQRALLVRVFQRRREHSKNLYYEVDESPKVYENRGGEPGKLLVGGMQRRYREWRLDDSYRMDSDMYNRDAEAASSWAAFGFDAKEGVGRGTIRTNGMKQTFGRIDTVHDPVTRSNRYKYWLDGDFPNKGEYLFRYLVEHEKDFEIKAPTAGDKVQLTVDYQPWWAGELGGKGKRKFLLDPQKGFLPVQGYSRWDAPPVGGVPNWRVEKFEVKESRLIEDVWMPIKLRETTSASVDADKVSVFEIAVTQIKYGTVKPADLVVPFTEGMEVVDAIKGVYYYADANGKPTDRIARLGQPMATATSPSVSSVPTGRHNGVMFACLGLLMFLVSVFLVRRWKKRKTVAV